MERYHFRKEERLCNKRLLKQLYQSGSSFLLYPYRVTYLPVSELPSGVQVILSVPKRNFKRAVDRNKIKRRMREAYRLHKKTHLYTFTEKGETGILLALQYVGKSEEPFGKIESRMKQVMKKLEAIYAELDLGTAR